MNAVNDYTSEIRDLYSEALLSARLRGIEGVPAMHVAVDQTVETINARHRLALTATDVRRVLRLREKAPFSLMLSQAPRWSAPAGREDEPIMDQRMAALLSQLNDAVHAAKA